MCKKLKFSALVLIGILLSINHAWGGSPATLQLSSSNKFGTTSGSTKTDNDSHTWTVTTSSGAIQNQWSGTSNNQYNGQQFGTGTTAWTGTFSTTTSNITITSVAITANTGGSATLAVRVGSSDFTCGGNTTTSVSKKMYTANTIGTYTFTGSATGNITISVSNTNKAFYLNKIVVTYSAASTKTLHYWNGVDKYNTATAPSTLAAPDELCSDNLTFLGWYEEEIAGATSCSKTIYSAGDACPNKSDLYAVYHNQVNSNHYYTTKPNKYAITYSVSNATKESSSYTCTSDIVSKPVGSVVTKANVYADFTPASGYYLDASCFTFTYTTGGTTFTPTTKEYSDGQLYIDGVDGDITITATAQTCTALSKPANPTIAENQIKDGNVVHGRTRLGWDRVTNNNGYTVYIYQNGTLTNTLEKAQNTEYVLANFGPGTWSFEVKAKGNGTTLCDSPVLDGGSWCVDYDLSANTPSITVTPTSASAVTLSWESVTNVAKYKVTIKNGGTPISGYNKKETTSTSMSVTGLTKGTAYAVEVVAYNNCDEDANSGAPYKSQTGTATIQIRQVDFNSNGGSSVTTQYVNNGATATEPSDPTKDYYDFNEWQLSGSTYSFSTAVTGDITLDADWSAKKYTVTTSGLTNITPNTAFPSQVTYTGSTTTALDRTLTATSGYKLPDNITVTMGGSTLTKGTHYSYNSTTGAFTFDVAVTGDIVISGSSTLLLSSIAITTQPTLAYLEGEDFSSTGAVVTATMGDGSTKAVTNSAVWTPPATPLEAGTSQTVQVSYTENGVTKTATTTINVYSVTVQKYNEDPAEIDDAGVTVGADGRTLSQSVGSTKYVFNNWSLITASGMALSSNSLTGTPTGNVVVRGNFYKPVTITWLKGGVNYTTGYPSGTPSTEVARGTQWKDIPVLPADPANNSLGACANTFMGWSNLDVEWTGDTHDEAPAILYKREGFASVSTEITAPITFRAVYATGSGGSSGSFDLTASDFGASFSSSESNITKLSTNDISYKQYRYNPSSNTPSGWCAASLIDIRGSNSGHGELYNNTEISGLTKLRFYEMSGATGLTVYTSTSKISSQPGSGGTALSSATGTESVSYSNYSNKTCSTSSITLNYYDVNIPSGNGYFYVYANSASYIYKITVSYSTTTYSDYVTMCGCTEYSFHSGSSDDETLKTTNNRLCFSAHPSDEDQRIISNYVIPEDTKFFVGKVGYFYNSNLNITENGSRSVIKTFSAANADNGLYFNYTKGYGNGYRPGVGQATGAVGTLYINVKSTWDNLHLGFDPAGYIFKLGSTYLTMHGSTTLDATQYRETDVVTLTSSNISNDNFQVNLYTGSEGGVASAYTESKALTTMGVKSGASTWRDGSIAAGDANTKGFFRINLGEGNATNWNAHWVPCWELTFNLKGGSGTIVTTPAVVSVEGDASARTVQIPTTAPTKDGYRFLGWSDDDNSSVEYAAGSTHNVVLSANKTVYAVWAQEYTLTYDANGGSTSCSGGPYIAGETVTVCATEPTKTASSFQGWLGDNGIGTKAAGATFTMPAANVIFTAQWQDTPYTLAQNVGSHTTKGYTATTIKSGDTSPSGLDLTYTISNNSYALPKTVTISGGRATWTLDTDYTWTLSSDKHSATLHINPTIISSNVTVTVAEQARYTITWDEHSSTSYSYYAADDNSLDWGDIADCGEKKFYGWTANAEWTAHASIPPAIVAKNSTVSASTTYFAVYGTKTNTGGYVKVTTVAEGETYLLACPSQSKVYVGQHQTDGYGDDADVTITNDTISSKGSAHEVRIEGSATKFAIYDKDASKYIFGPSTDAATCSWSDGPTASGTTQHWWNIGSGDYVGEIQGKNQTARYFAYNYNGSNHRFAAYKTPGSNNSGKVYFYKFVPGFKDYSKTCTLYDITIDDGITGGTIVAKNQSGTTITQSGAGATVTVIPTPNSCKYMSALSYTYNDGVEDHEVEITLDANDEYTFTMPAYDVELTATFSNKTVSSIAPATSTHRVLMQGVAGDFVGEQITVNYNSGETETLDWDDTSLSWSGYNMATLGNQTVRVDYDGACGDAYVTYSIEITDGVPITYHDGNSSFTRKYELNEVVGVDTITGKLGCSGYVFSGWSETAISTTDDEYVPVHNFAATTARTLYAVYTLEKKQGWMSIENATYVKSGAEYLYVKVRYSDAFAMSNTASSVNSNYLAATVVTSSMGTWRRSSDSKDFQTFTGTPAVALKWQVIKSSNDYYLYNANAAKYLKITTSAIGLTTTPEDDFNFITGGNDCEVIIQSDNSKYYASGYYNNPNYYFNPYSSETTGHYLITKDSLFTTMPPCAPRSVEFHGNGGTVTGYGGSPTGADVTIEEASRDAGIKLPIAEYGVDCNGTPWTFIGWSDEEIDITRVPILTTDLLEDGVTNADHEITSDNEQYWAVYSNTGVPETKYGTITFTQSEFPISYNTTEATLTKTVSGVGDYDFKYYQVCHASGHGIQINHDALSKGYIKNATSLGKITSISFSSFGEGEIGFVQVYVGNTADAITTLLNPSTCLQTVSGVSTYYPNGNYQYVKIQYSNYTAIGNITINFGQGTTVYATTPTCSVITLSGDVKVTSTSGQSMKALTPIAIFGNELAADQSVTLKAYNVSDDTENTHFTFSAITKSGSSIPNQNITVTYNPSGETTDGIENVYFKAVVGDIESNKLNGYGRHLPAKFVIAEKVGDDWYALPNGMGSNYTSWTGAVKLSEVNEETGVATFYSDTTDQFAYELIRSKALDNAGMVFGSQKMKAGNPEVSKLIKANTTASTSTIGLYAQSGWNNGQTPTAPYFEFTPSTNDLVNYTLKNTFQNNYLGITSSKWGIGASATVRFLSIDQHAAPTITWRNNTLDSEDPKYNHTTNTAENGVVTVPNTESPNTPVSCNSTLMPTFCGWSATEPTGNYWVAAPSYITTGTAATENTTYYAVFKDATRNRWYTRCPEFKTLTFNRGTGTGDDYVVYTENSTYTMPDAATTGHTKAGYTLSGWTASAAVTVGGNPVAAGEFIAVGADVSGISTDVTFTAVWAGNITITAPNGVWLTSYNDVSVYTTSATSNNITISTAAKDGATGVKITYFDGNGTEITTLSNSLFRLCNDGSSDYNIADNGGTSKTDANRLAELTQTGGVGDYKHSYSIRYTPNAYNTTDTYTLKVQLMRNTTPLSEATLTLHGRALPQEFLFAVKDNDNQWYALPNTILDNTNAIKPIKITVDNTTTPTAATYAPNTVVYKGAERYASGTNVYGIRFTDGVIKDAKYAHLQVSQTSSTNHMWLSYTGSSTCQDWMLLTSDFGAYTLKMPSSGNETKQMGIDSHNFGYYNNPTSGTVYILPITNKLVDNPATVTEWGQKSVILDVDAQSAVSARARLGAGSPETAASFGQTLTSVKSYASKYNYTLSFNTLDFSLHKGELLYIDWLDGSSNVLSTSQITIPWIIASTNDMKSIDGTKGHWETEVHVLPGVTLTANGGSFGSSTVVVKELNIYPGATVNVTTGTLNATTLILRNGWSRAGSTRYDVARLLVTTSAGTLKATNVYADWYIDYDQYYPVAVPWNVNVSGISYQNTTASPTVGPSGQIRLRYYDGASRADNGQTGVGSGANWKEYGAGDNTAVPATLVPGIGYAMTAKRPTGKAFSVVRMPLTLPSGTWGEGSWTTGGEKGEVSEVHKDQVSVTAHGADANPAKPTYLVGWNFIANPYMAIYKGALTHSVAGEEIEYVTIPDIYFKDYGQYPAETKNLLPASGFFIQTSKTGTLTFDTSNRKASAPGLRKDGQTPTFTKQKAYITLSDDNAEDMMGLIVSEKYTADYEINADLEKSLGEGNSLKTYMQYEGMNMAYLAINKTLAMNWIPVVVRIPATGEYTFTMDNASVVDELEGVYLIDYSNNQVTNLINNDYTFSAEAGTITGRFAINGIVGEKTATSVDEVGSDSEGPQKFIYHDKMYILNNGVIYDAVGKKVSEIK